MSFLDDGWTPPLLSTPKAKGKATPAAGAKAPKARATSIPQSIVDDPQWRPARRLWLVGRQHCAACGSVTDYIAADTVEFVNAKGATRRVAYVAAGGLSPFLPTETDFDGLEATTVAFCPACLRLSHHVDDLLTELSAVRRQAELWPCYSPRSL